MLRYPDLDPVAVAVGPLTIHWYGLMYLLGFAAAWWLAKRRAALDWTPLGKDQIDDLIFYGALGVILGGRFGYVLFYNFDRFLAEPWWLLQVWEGGMSFHGGLLGVFIAMLWYSRRLNVGAGDLMDFVAPLVPLGLGLGRLGNFIGQELWGRASEVPWAMVFPADPAGVPRHPSQLYQFALEGLVLFGVVWWYSRKPRPTWSVGALFFMLYGIFRFGVEFLREPDRHIGFDALGWMTRGQLLSLPMIVLGATVLGWAWREHRYAGGSVRRH